MPTLRQLRWDLLLAGLVICTAHIELAWGITYRVVALSDQSAPNTSLSFRNFGLPTLNNSGQVAFGSTFVGVTTRGIFSEGGGALHRVALTGDLAPGTDAGVRFAGFVSNDPTPINDAGQIAFRANLAGTGVISSNDFGIWTEGGGALRLVAREGAAAPGTAAGVHFSSVNAPVFNDAGHAAFTAELAGAGVTSINGAGIWTEQNGALQLAIRGGTAPPGAVGDEVLTSFSSFSGLGINNAGEIAFRARLVGANVSGLNDEGIWAGSPGSLHLVARDGMSAPDSGTGISFYSLGIPSLNQAGQIAFHSVLTGPGVDSSNDNAIWSESGGLHAVIRENSTPNGSGFHVRESYFSDPVINAAGHVQFSIIPASASDRRTVWSEDGSGLHVVAEQRTDAPGTADAKFGIFDARAFNAAGQTAFYAQLNAEISNESINDGGIWISGPSGLQLVARRFQPFTLAPGDTRIIDRIHFAFGNGNESGHASALNDRGQLAFRLTFTDDSQAVIVANTLTVPEPSSWGLAALGVIVAVGRCRRESFRRRAAVRS